MNRDSNLSRLQKIWCLYDWANSSYATTILAVLLQSYFINTVPSTLSFLGYRFNIPPDALWTYSITISVVLVIIVTPIIGRIGDRFELTAYMLLFFSILGSISSGLLYFFTKSCYLLGIILFILSYVGFAGGNVFYNALLPIITGKDPKLMDKVSTTGFAYGYLGGGLLLLAQFFFLFFVSKYKLLPLEKGIRIVFLTVGVWWFIFSLPFYFNLDGYVRLHKEYSHYNNSISSSLLFRSLLRKLLHYKKIIIFLIAFLLYNEGVETVIVISASYGERVLNLSQTELVLVVLMIQLLGAPFTMLWNKVAYHIGTINSIFLSLGIWVSIILYAALFLSSKIEYWILGGAVASVLGGVQSLSRSYFGAIIPKKETTFFYSLFNGSGKVSGALGPFFYGTFRLLGFNVRNSVLLVGLFFILGALLLFICKKSNPKD